MKTVKILSILLIVLLLVIFYQDIADYMKIITDQEAVSAYLQSFGILGPVVLFGLLIAQVFIAIIPGHALMVTAGYVYGTLGLVVVITSTILGSEIAFFIARRYGRELIYKLASQQTIDKWDKAAHNQGILFYFFSFLLPIFPNDLMCYVAGLATISPKRFFVANVLGRTCTAVIVTMIGMYGLNPPAWFLVALALAVIGLFAGWTIYRKKNILTNEQKPLTIKSKAQSKTFSKIFLNSVFVKILFSTLAKLL
ncbi:MAG: TVP38/TMEM64 family protein [Anaerolineales bacterium]|nr:TVP38/TMEM64 family protein [Anaerolineales bacterium]